MLRLIPFKTSNRSNLGSSFLFDLSFFNKFFKLPLICLATLSQRVTVYSGITPVHRKSRVDLLASYVLQEAQACLSTRSYSSTFK